MAPAAMIGALAPPSGAGWTPWCPTVPGLVSEMVVPWKSAGVSLARARASHQVVEGADVLLEIRARPAFLMFGTIRLRAPSLPATSTAIPRLICGRTRRKRLAVLLGVGVVQPGDFFQRLDDGPADEVGVGDFAAADQRAVLIDDAAVFVHHLDGDGALRGGERNAESSPPCSRRYGPAAPRKGDELLARRGFQVGGRRGGSGGRRRGAVGRVAPAVAGGSAKTCFQLSSTVERSCRYC